MGRLTELELEVVSMVGYTKKGRPDPDEWIDSTELLRRHSNNCPRDMVP